MNKKFIAIIGAISLLSACETASQKVVSGSSASGSHQLQALLIKRKVYLLQLNKQQLIS